MRFVGTLFKITGKGLEVNSTADTEIDLKTHVDVNVSTKDEVA